MTSQYFFKSQESLATVIDIDEEEDLEEDIEPIVSGEESNFSDKEKVEDGKENKEQDLKRDEEKGGAKQKKSEE